MPTASAWSSRPRRNPPAEVAFDSWLSRSLHASYGEAAQESVPPELLDIIRRNTSK